MHLGLFPHTGDLEATCLQNGREVWSVVVETWADLDAWQAWSGLKRTSKHDGLQHLGRTISMLYWKELNLALYECSL